MSWSKRPVTAQAPTAPVTAFELPQALAQAGATVTCEVMAGPSAGKAFSLGGQSCVIGSDESCDVRLEDPTVSRRHAEATFYAGAVNLIDLGSRNALVFMGQRAPTLVLPWDAEVRLGRSVVRFTRPKEAGRSTAEVLAGHVVGRSAHLQELFYRLERLGPREVPVVLEGPTGAGKEVCARALHALSPRKLGPFVVFDCASAMGNLFEAELFGVEAGAFTGAEKSRAGLAEAARGGTLLFDNVDALALELQPKLLRLLDSKEFRRVGGNAPKQADFRAVATSQRELLGLCSDGRFRSDLYFRLAGAVLELAPLSDHREDVEPLAVHFATQTGATLSAAQLAALREREYPGNVRQLKHEVARLLTGAEQDSAQEQAGSRFGYNEARDLALQSFEARYLRELLAQTKGNVSVAAKVAGLSRSQFYRVLRRHPSVMKMVRNE